MRATASNKKTTATYVEYDSDEFYDTSEAPVVAAPVSNAFICEKVLGLKLVRKNEDREEDGMDELFYIKWKGLSYLHASWERREDIESIDPGGKQKLRRFLQSVQAPGVIDRQALALYGLLPPPPASSSSSSVEDDSDAADKDDDEDVVEYFNPEFLEVQRVISCSHVNVPHRLAKTSQEIFEDAVSITRKMDVQDVKDIQYLVKWRGSTYAESTWERYEDIRGFSYEIWRFWQVQQPPKLPIKVPPFPSLQQYKKMEESPLFGLSTDHVATVAAITVANGQDDDSANDVINKNNKKNDKKRGRENDNSDVVVSEERRKRGVEGQTNDKEEEEEEADHSASATARVPSAAAAAVQEGLRLREYQLEGVNWLLWNWWHKRPCVLADEMGLGKTIQTIGFLHQLRFMSTTKVPGPFLIIAPLSLVDQWQSEIETWSPQMNVVLLHGDSVSRETILNFEFYFSEPFTSRQDAAALKRSGVHKFHILLTTFEMATKEVKTLARINWSCLIVDEAHKLKNQDSKLFATLVTIPRKFCVLLTGTPLQNKTEELWALLNFADPVRFANQLEFISKFGDLKEASQVASLHSMLKPYLLRRIKEDVEKSLPHKEETIVEVALTAVQKRYYRAIFERNTVYLYRGLKSSNQPSLMNIMMELRKCCNHPYLIKGVEEQVMADVAANPPPVVLNATASSAASSASAEDGVDGSTAVVPIEINTVPSASTVQTEASIRMTKLIECSGKLVLLDKLLPKLYAQGHKVLIFSQMVRVLNILEDFLRYKNYSFERLDGSTRSSDRKMAVDRFCNPAYKRFVMLLSTKAGGLGLNLTAADTVIIFDR